MIRCFARPGWRICAFTLAIIIPIFVSLASSIPTGAQSPVYGPPQGISLIPGDTPTQVQLRQVSVLFDLLPADQTPASLGTNAVGAKVTASFKLYNTGSQAEEFEVRLPLAQLKDGPGGLSCVSPFVLMLDLSASVDGQPVPVKSEKLNSFRKPPVGGTPAVEVSMSCWVLIPARFPPGQAVSITVSYLTRGMPVPAAIGEQSPPPLSAFWYDLKPGLAWNGPVQSAELIFRPPYPVDRRTAPLCAQDSLYPSVVVDCSDGQQLRLRFESYSAAPSGPTPLPGTTTLPSMAELTNPADWQPAAEIEQVLAQQPDNAEAWGQLGDRTLALIWLENAFRSDASSQALYDQAVKAYTMAISLQPGSAQWNGRYTDLLCRNAHTRNFGGNDRANLADCARQVKITLDLDPRNADALAWLHRLSEAAINPTYAPIDASGPTPIYRILTVMPTETPGPTPTPVPQSVKESSIRPICWIGLFFLAALIAIIRLSRWANR